MTSAAGLPRTPPQRAPMRRGVRELIIAVAALPLLVATGVYLGLHAGESSAGGRTSAASTPSPLVTVTPATPTPVVTVQPAKPGPVVTVQPAKPGPVVTVQPAKPGPVVTVQPAKPGPVVTVQPAKPGPVVTVQPAAPAAVATVVPASPPPPNVGPSLRAPVAPRVPPAPPPVLLARGYVGPDVRAWQAQMARRTWRIRVDGIFGRQTRRVVLRFQREKGLVVDGIVGPRTWAAAWRLPVTH